MKNKLFYSLLFLSMISCKQTDFSKSESDVALSDTISNKKISSCDDAIMKLIKSSNLNLKDYGNNFFVRIDEIRNDSIDIHVYVENNLSDNVHQKQIVESTIAWLIFLPNKKKLLNITNDPDNPKELKFKYTDFDIFYKECGIEKKEVDMSTNYDSLMCKEISLEMGSGKECLIKNTNIQSVYKDLIKNGEIEDVDFFLNKLPIENQILQVNKNGLMTIEYIINQNKIEIIMSYEGGTTKVDLEKLDNDVKRNIYYYAD